ncbi:MAG: sigma-70 family RNA polymerase sigma factor [Omnitrophica bacterium]|nr:sigma-70 family RNA polymerase sigma factor [Candidatus Omnitrophota bacterium]
MHPPDKELVKKAKRKDKNAFTLLVDRYSDRIFSYLYRYVGDYQKAEDLTIETFLNAYTRIRTYREMGKFSAWLYMIATNCAKKELQKRKRLKEVSIDRPFIANESITLKDLISDERSRPDYNARQAEFKEFIYKIIANLDKKYKDVLLLCDVEGLSYREVARALRCNVITVGTRIRRARTLLYKSLKRYGYKF